MGSVDTGAVEACVAVTNAVEVKEVLGATKKTCVLDAAVVRKLHRVMIHDFMCIVLHTF